MWCVRCNHDVRECTCPDIAERLREVSEGEHNAARWCSVCDRHYSQCHCPNPVWSIRVGGKLRAAEFQGKPIQEPKPVLPHVEGKCRNCEQGNHHPTEHLPRSDYSELKVGDIVLVRAIITKIEVGDFSTAVEVKQYEPGYPQWAYWTAKVNSVDVFDAPNEPWPEEEEETL